MAEWVPMQIGSKLYKPHSTSVAHERLVNLYAEPNDAGSKNGYPFTLYGTPGLDLLYTVAESPGRGLYYFQQNLYIVSGTRLYLIDSVGTTTDLGEIGGTGRVRMTDNGTYVIITTSGPAYAANTSGIIELAEGNFSSVTFQDGYIVLSRAGDFIFYVSAPDDITIGPADFASVASFPGNIVGHAAINREQYFFKTDSVEVWYNSGAAAFPFELAGSGVIRRGCKPGGAGSIIPVRNQIYWVADNNTVCRTVGYQYEEISTPTISKIISGDETLIEAFAYSEHGHEFYVLQLTGSTLVYDIATGLWHERKSSGATWLPIACVRRGNANVVLDSDGNIYEMSLDYLTDNGTAIEREVITPYYSQSPRPLFFHEIFLDVQSGVGLTVGQGSDPKVMLDWSDDQGETFHGGRMVGIGKIGEYKNRALFTRLGRSYSRLWRFRVTDPVVVTILGASLRAEAG